MTTLTAPPPEPGFACQDSFRTALAGLIGCRPEDLAQDGLLKASWIPTPLGDMVVVVSDTHLHLLEFTERKALPGELHKLYKAARGGIGIGRNAITEQATRELGAYFIGRRSPFRTPLHQAGSAFSQTVWTALRAIPAGETRSYSQLAKQIGRPDATRAVARANGANQIAVMVPCHRLIGADGALTGYGGGLWRKQRLLELEGARVVGNSQR